MPVGRAQVFGATLTEYGDVEYGCCLTVRLYDTDYDRMESSNAHNSDGTAKTLRVESASDGVEEAGTYFIEVSLDDDASPRPVSFEIAADVTGDAVETPTPTATPAEGTDEAGNAGDEGDADEAAAVTDSGEGTTLCSGSSSPCSQCWCCCWSARSPC